MNKPALPRLAAACGAIFAVGLTAANGSGNQPFGGLRAIAGIAALTLILPFFGYLCGLLRGQPQTSKSEIRNNDGTSETGNQRAKTAGA